jgi:iron-sulfur cluster insertion protein
VEERSKVKSMAAQTNIGQVVGINLITVTESAKQRINDILYDHGNPNLAIRISVQGGGCSGFQYKFAIEHTPNEDDLALDTGAFKILIDSASVMYMDDAVIDYQESLMNSQFVVQNPNAQSQCGCGSSFSV